VALHSKAQQLARSGGSRNSAPYRPSASTAATPTNETLVDEIAALEHDRNADHAKADWQFTIPNARLNSSTYC
jgi:hypothetical protein